MWETVLRWFGLLQPTKAESTAVQKEPCIEASPAAEPLAEVAQPPSLVVNGGSNNLQVGHAAGNVVSLVTHHSHTHTHVTLIQTPSQAPANEPQVRKPSSTEHSAMLRRMDQLRDRVAVLDFMEEQFGTRMVIHLKAEQLYRLNRYLDVVLSDPRNVKRQRAGRVA